MHRLPRNTSFLAFEAPFLHEIFQCAGHLQQALPLVARNDAAAEAIRPADAHQNGFLIFGKRISQKNVTLSHSQCALLFTFECQLTSRTHTALEPLKSLGSGPDGSNAIGRVLLRSST